MAHHSDQLRIQVKHQVEGRQVALGLPRNGELEVQEDGWVGIK